MKIHGIEVTVLEDNKNIINLELKSGDKIERENGTKYAILSEVFKKIKKIPENINSEVIVDGRYAKYGVIVPMMKGLYVFGDSQSNETELLEAVTEEINKEENTDTYLIICAILNSNDISYEDYKKTVYKYIPEFKLNGSKIFFAYCGL